MTAPSVSNLLTGSAGRVLYRDDFSDPNSGWLRESWDTAQALIGYERGEYFVVRTANASTLSVCAFSPATFTDFQAEVNARLVPPSDGAYIMIGFRLMDINTNYIIGVSPNNGPMAMAYQSNGTSTIVIPYATRSEMNRGNATNRIGVRARGAELVMLLNGQEVGRVQDDSLRAGALALCVAHNSGGRAEARFSNLVVTTIE